MALTQGQRRCVETLDRSLVVAAGAGSGKTFTLTQRIAGAIADAKIDGIERVCAITFTNKAAGELKSRLKSELRFRGLDEQALKVDEAWVSTIHGMCARILRAHAIELDIDPAFKMADAAIARSLRDRAIEDVLVRAQSGGAEGSSVDGAALDALFAEYPARSYGPGGTSVESMLQTLMDAASSNICGVDAFAVAPMAVNPASLVSIALDTLDALADAALAQKPNEAREEWAANAKQTVASIRAAMQDGKASDVAWVLQALDALPRPKKVGTADYKEQVAQALDTCRMCIMELRLLLASAHLRTLVQLAREATEAYALAKRREGVLDNNDLLVMASNAIEDHPDIAALYTDKFQLVMVDEFQDTDQMQVDMIKRLAGPGACRLCTVGDAQQSIYRFRGADVSVYRRHLAKVQAGNAEDVIELYDNFRSHPDVLALVDRVFEQPGMFGGEYKSLLPGRDEAKVKRPFVPGEPRVQVQLTSKPYRGPSKAQVREQAAARIAATFADLHEKGHSAGDMALLLGGMTYAGVYADAIRARGLACVISGGSVFSGTPEAKTIRDLVRVIANPRQTQSLHNVLTGPMFELCAGDVAQLVTGADPEGAFRRKNLYVGLRDCVRAYRDIGQDAAWSAQLALAVRVMGSVLGAAGRSQVSRVAMRAVVDSGWISRLQDRGAEGLASAANVYKAIRMVESIESSAAVGPARVAQLFEVTLDQAKEAPGALSATGGDFVRIMTVHASKGLEFPIVAVAEFKDGGGDSSRLLEAEIGGRIYLSLDLNNTVSSLKGCAKVDELPALYASMVEGKVDEDELARAVEQADGALSLRSALYEHERLGDEEESKRLLYVALTRAKEALVISLMGVKTKVNPFASPASCLQSVVSALAGPEGGFEVGMSHFDYRGSSPAVVEHVELDGADGADGADDGGQGGTSAEGPGCAPGAEALFKVPAAEPYVPIHRLPYAPAHDGVFSYSSIAGASHEGSLLDDLARRYCIAIDGAEQKLLTSLWLQPAEDAEGEMDFSLGWHRVNRNAAVVDEDDGSWAYTGASCDDSDKATDLGTAFHRLAQYAVATRSHGALVRPPADRIAAFARACKLDEVQRERLEESLDRWFASDVAAEMAALGDLRAEVPFFVDLPEAGGGAEAFLEGEIDLLGLDGDGSVAHVVDYKTGGRDDELPDELACKHVLQAACYAYAIMLQGAQTVQATFVRVERARSDAPDQPQCVRYRFTSADMGDIARAIAEAYGRLLGGDAD